MSTDPTTTKLRTRTRSTRAAVAALALVSVTAVLDGTTFAAYDPDRPLHRPALVVRADPAYDAAFQPDHEHRLHRTSPRVPVFPMPGAGHNIRGDRATRDRYLDVLTDFLTHQPSTTMELQS